MVTELKNAGSHEGTNNRREGHGDPEESETSRQFGRREPVGEVQDGVGNEATLKETQQSAENVEARLAAETDLRNGNRRPEQDLDGNPAIGAELLADCSGSAMYLPNQSAALTHLGREFGDEETRIEDGVADVVVGSGHVKVIEKVVRKGISEVVAIKVHGGKADAHQKGDA